MTMGDAQERSVKPSIDVFKQDEDQNDDEEGFRELRNDLIDESMVDSLLTESIELTGMDDEENKFFNEEGAVEDQPRDQGGLFDD